MSNALILGCSHAAGALMHDDPEYGARNSYPVILANLLGYTAHNHAISGGSNDAIFRIFNEKGRNYNLVIACWTGMHRGEYFHPDHEQWTPINYGEGESYVRKPSPELREGKPISTEVNDKKLYEDYGKLWLTIEGNKQRGRDNKIKNILALNTLAASQGTRVINLDSFQGAHKFPWPTEIYRPCEGHRNEFVNFCNYRKFPTEPRGHYFREAHQAYAEYIKAKIDLLGGLRDYNR